MIQVVVLIARVAASSKRSSSPAVFVVQVSYQTSNAKCARVSYYFVIWYLIFYSKYIRAYPPVPGQYVQYTTVQQYTAVYFCTWVTAVSYVWYALYRFICMYFVCRLNVLEHQVRNKYCYCDLWWGVHQYTGPSIPYWVFVLYLCYVIIRIVSYVRLICIWYVPVCRLNLLAYQRTWLI